MRAVVPIIIYTVGEAFGIQEASKWTDNTPYNLVFFF